MDDRFHLHRNPGLVRMQCCRRENYPPRLHVQKRQHEHFADSRQRQNLLGEKVALPQTGRVPGDKLIQGCTRPLRARLDARRLQDSPHRAHLDRPNAKFLELSHDPRIAPLVLSGHPENQAAQPLPRPTAFRRGFRFALLRSAIFTNPAQKRVGRNDRHRLSNGLAQLRFEFQQPLSLARRDHDPRGQFAS